VHSDVFRDIRPVHTIMHVSRFIDPEWLVEIEADAVVTPDNRDPHGLPDSVRREIRRQLGAD